MKSSLISSRKESRHELMRYGLTMAELLVVLTILAVVTLTAVKTMTPVAEQARFESTQKTLEAIRAAVVNIEPGNSLNPSVSGFIADVGRLPTLTTLNDGTQSIPELYSPSLDALVAAGADIAGYATTSFTSPYTSTNGYTITFPTTPYMTMSRGWRGPYFRVPTGANRVKDGWGNALVADHFIRETSTNYVLAVQIPLPADYIQFSPLEASWASDVSGSLAGNVSFTTTTNTSYYPVVLLFEPASSTSANSAYDVLVNSSGVLINSAGTTNIAYNFANRYVGPRVLCAAYSTVPAPTTAYTVVGQPLYVSIKPRGTQGPAWSANIP